MIRLKIGLEIRHRGVLSLCAIEEKTAVVVVASYRSVSRNPVRFKALRQIIVFQPESAQIPNLQGLYSWLQYVESKS